MLHKKGNFKKGVYRPRYREKYKGLGNPDYRSSWELHFFKWCDFNKNVLEWSAESVIIPYVSPMDNKVHRYFVDNHVVIKEGNKKSKYLVEIKPHKQTVPPVESKRKKKTTILHEKVTYSVNQAKWSAAKNWCKKHGYRFLILTEKELFKK